MKHFSSLRTLVHVLPKKAFYGLILSATIVSLPQTGRADDSQTAIQSPDGRNSITLQTAGDDDRVRYTVSRDGRILLGPSVLGPVLAEGRRLGDGARIVEVKRGKVDETFTLPWGKTREVPNQCEFAVVTMATGSNLQWQIELRAYDVGSPSVTDCCRMKDCQTSIFETK